MISKCGLRGYINLHSTTLAPALRFGASAGVLAGWLLGLWTNYVQFTLGRGTPVPVMATQKLLICPPYSYCRNPMALGAIVAYLGVCVVAGSPGAGLLWFLGAVAILFAAATRLGDRHLPVRE